MRAGRLGGGEGHELRRGSLPVGSPSAMRTTTRFASPTSIRPKRRCTRPSRSTNHPGRASSSASVARGASGVPFSVTAVTSAPHVPSSITVSRVPGAPAYVPLAHAIAQPPLPDRRRAHGSVKVGGGLAIVLVEGEAAGATRRGGVDPEDEILAWWSVAAFAESVQRRVVDGRLRDDGAPAREEGKPE